MIVSLGECLIDFTPLEERGELVGFRLHPAGSPYNVAVGLARLEYAAGFAGRLSEDFFGKILAEHLARNRVDTTLVQSGSEPSPLAFVSFRQGEASYTFRIDHTTATGIRSEDFNLEAFLELEALHFGSISLLHEPAASSIVSLLRTLHGKVPISFDPNVRADLVTDWVSYRDTVRTCIALSDLVKVSERDLEALGEADVGGWISDKGPTAVVVTRGAAGSQLYRDGEILECPAVSCRLVDTVGAGDAYTAGLLVALAERNALSRRGVAELSSDQWLEVMRFASTAAAITCERQGADLAKRAEVLARISQQEA